MALTVTKKKVGKVTEVWCTFDFKISKDYQSTGASLGMKATVEPGEDVNATIIELKQRVRKSLSVEYTKAEAFLKQIS